MTQLSHQDYQATRWRSKPRNLWGSNHERPRNEENVPPDLDYKAIEQIADGVEKMILAWSNGEESETARPCLRKQGVESGALLPGACAKGLQRQGQTSLPAIKGPLSEKTFAEDGGCNYMCPVQIQEGPSGITSGISIRGNCPAAGMGSSISQIVRAESITNKDTHAEKSVTKTATATYWYMEASNGKSSGCQGNSRKADEKPESTGRIEEFRSTFNQSCFNDNGADVRHWSKEEIDARSVFRSESEKIRSSPRNDAGRGPSAAAHSSNAETRQRTPNHRTSRHSRKKGNESSRHPSVSEQEPGALLSNSGSVNNKKDIHSQSGHTHKNLRDEALETPLSARVNTGQELVTASMRAGCFDALFDSVVVDDELLEKKLAALTTMPSTPLLSPVELSEDDRHKQVQDLQIALLECAMEYEIKTIELKMKIKNLQVAPKNTDQDSKTNSDRTAEMLYPRNSRESQIVESMKKQIFKLQREKAAVTKEFLLLKTKEKKFETQQRSLDDALLRVNRLTKEVVRKEHELLESQLMEKETRVKLQEIEAGFAKTEASRMPPAAKGIEPEKLVAALPSLREWIRTLKNEQGYEPMVVKMMDGYYSPGEDHDHTEALKSRSTTEVINDSTQKVVEKVVHTLMKEVQALQRDLGKLGGCRSLRPKKVRSVHGSHFFISNILRQSENTKQPWSSLSNKTNS